MQKVDNVTEGHSRNQPPPVIFFSYSREDKLWLDKFREILAPLRRNGIVMTWSDNEIEPGQRWREQIDRALAEAKVGVLLVSPAFLASEFITEIELPYLLAAAENRGVKLVWVLIRDCMYTYTPLAEIQAAHDLHAPLEHLHPDQLHTTLVAIAERIVRIAQTIRPKAQPDEESLENQRAVLSKIIEELQGQVAEAPDDVQNAIESGLAGVDNVLSNIGSSRHQITIDDVRRVLHEAIQHGAGIYNHPSKYGHIGCARIYHRAAAGVLALMPGTVSRPEGRPPQDIRLAMDWLGRVIEKAPNVEDDTAEELAWELRFAFDAIQHIGLFDEVNRALASTIGATNMPDLVCSMVRAVIKQSDVIPILQVNVYLLRHAAQVVHWLITEGQRQEPYLQNAKRRLNLIFTDDPRILRQNLGRLKHELLSTLAEMCQVTETRKNGLFHWLRNKFGHTDA